MVALVAGPVSRNASAAPGTPSLQSGLQPEEWHHWRRREPAGRAGQRPEPSAFRGFFRGLNRPQPGGQGGSQKQSENNPWSCAVDQITEAHFQSCKIRFPSRASGSEGCSLRRCPLIHGHIMSHEQASKMANAAAAKELWPRQRGRRSW